MRFDLTDLRLFVHAYEAGSMTEAAARGHLTLAAVSARIRALEEEAGVPLLHRHARGVTATAAGEVLARHARIVLRQVELLARDFARQTRKESSPTVIFGNSSALARPIGATLAELLARQPTARVEVRESSSEVTVQALRAGAADLGIVSDAVAVEGLGVRLLGDDPLVLVAAEGHALAGDRSEIRFVELLSQDWIGWSEPAALSTHLALHALRAGRPIRYRVMLPSTVELLSLVKQGHGITVLPAALVARSEGLVTRPVKESWAKRKLLLCSGTAPVSPGVAEIADLLQARWPV